MAIRYINGIPNVPRAVGPYSQVTIIDNLIYLSGQIGLNPETMEMVVGGVAAECDQVMKNILAVLGFLNIDFSHVMKTTIFLADMKDFQLVNGVYDKWLLGCKPARSTIQVAALPLGARVEIEAIAYLDLKDSPHLPQGSIKDFEDLHDSSVSCKGKDSGSPSHHNKA